MTLRRAQRGSDRIGFRAALRNLKRAYDDLDAGHVLDAYDEARRRSLGFRMVAAGLERVYPVRAFLDRAAHVFDPAIGELGLHAGCRQVFEHLGIPWEAAIPRGAEEALRTKPVLFYGNHPSLLTPFLAAAAIDREDLHFCSTNYVRRLIPRFRSYCHPLEIPLTRSWTEWRRGGLQRVLAYRLLSLLHTVPGPAEAREINLAALDRAADDLRNGGSVMIIPGGGGRRDRTWFGGIGILARSLLAQPGADDVLAVPIREENSSNHRVYAILMNGPLARLRRRMLDRRAVRMRFAPPVPLREVVGEVDSTADAVQALRAHYDSCFPRGLCYRGRGPEAN